MNIIHILKSLTHFLLAIVSILFIVTGLGISSYQIVEPLTGGVLSKLTSFQIHSNLLIPFIVLLIAHIGFTIGKKIKNKQFKHQTFQHPM